jgi:Uri superfamily endonuclease
MPESRSSTPHPEPALPNTPGSYVLVLRLEAATTLHAGRLGVFTLAAGWYAYTGSALGPGGLRARVGRHLRADKKPHWHIDALTAAAAIPEVWAVESRERLECAWAAALAAHPEVSAPLPGFGASDCACNTHLLRIPAPQSTLEIIQMTSGSAHVLRVFTGAG